jgi:hypothetical protein
MITVRLQEPELFRTARLCERGRNTHESNGFFMGRPNRPEIE